ncbi:MAG: hypothetical protein WCK43_06015 [bacterium]
MRTRFVFSLIFITQLAFAADEPINCTLLLSHFADIDNLQDNPRGAIHALKAAKESALTDSLTDDVLDKVRSLYPELWARNIKKLPSNSDRNDYYYQLGTLAKLQNKHGYSVLRIMSILRNLPLSPDIKKNFLLNRSYQHEIQINNDEDYNVLIKNLKNLGFSNHEVAEIAQSHVFETNEKREVKLIISRKKIFDAWLSGLEGPDQAAIRIGWLHESFFLQSHQSKDVIEILLKNLNFKTEDLIKALERGSICSAESLSFAINHLKQSGRWQDGDFYQILEPLIKNNSQVQLFTLVRNHRNEWLRLKPEQRIKAFSSLRFVFERTSSFENFKEAYSLTEDEARASIESKARLEISETPKGITTSNGQSVFNYSIFNPYLHNFSKEEIVAYLKAHAALGVDRIPSNFRSEVNGSNLWTHYKLDQPENFSAFIDIVSTAKHGPEDDYMDIAEFIKSKNVPKELREKLLYSRLAINHEKVISLLLKDAPNPVPGTVVKSLVEKGESLGAIAPGSYRLISEQGSLQDGPINLSLLRELNSFQLEKGRLPHDTTELRAWSLGVNEASMRASKSSKSLNFKKDFYGVLSELKNDLGAKPFPDLALPELDDQATRNKFLSVLEQLKSHYQIELIKTFPSSKPKDIDSSSRLAIWEKVAKEWTLNRNSSAADILALEKTFTAKTQNYFAEILAMNGSTLNPEDLNRLKEEWGDLSPLLVLTARFGAEGHENLQIELARVFESSLKGKFSEYKFHGQGFNEDDISKAAAQMAPLKSPKQIEEWKKDRSLLKIVQPEGFDIAKVLALEKEAFETHFKTNLLPNLEYAGIRLENSQPNTRQAIMDIFGKREDPLFLLEEARKAIGGDKAVADKKILESIIDEFKEGYNPEKTSLLARKISALLSKSTSDFAFRNNQQFKSDIDHIAKMEDGRKQMDRQESIIITSSTIDPKLSILTGDLVDASSCQNYRTGTVVKTLLGYVTDNTRLILSQHLTPGDFSAGQFAELKQAVANNSPIDVQINRRDLSLEIKFINSKGSPLTLKSPARKFYRRHVLKLGEAESGGPGLFMERGYTQTSPVQNDMAAEALRLMKETAKAIEAKTGEAVTIPPSRNPEGQYSDAAEEGVQKNAYKIPADPTQK